MTVVSLATRIPVAQQLKVLERKFSTLSDAFDSQPLRGYKQRQNDLKRLHQSILPIDNI
ncbi:hypothetical protein [Veronia nyctiphanis]|uniref:hypothetical protein n=1 Tax=Veronia nyctiphanis TaxID=1278244 RepID=UPI001375F61F|nr:hypothetical protein [Veronia nyctiphanis]